LDKLCFGRLTCVLAGGACRFADGSPRVLGAVLFLTGLFAVQQLSLRARLDRHFAKLIAEGAPASPSGANLHRAYVLLEIAKALGLILLILFQLMDFPRQ
jgi:predicted secreted protein